MKKIFSLFIVIVAFAFNTFAQQNLRDGYEAYTLKNGMKVYLWVDKEMPDVYGQVAVRAGSIDEPADFTGLAHYLEHMLFKGTQQIGALDWEKEKPMYEKIVALYDDLAKLKLPKSKKDKTYAAIQAQRDELMRQINELTVASSHISQGSEFPTLLQSIGSTALNAYTNFDQTVYHNSFPAYQMEKWLKVYYDHFQNPVFREFQAEMENVFEELNMRTPSVDYQQYIAIYENLFKGSNYARGVIGSPEHLKNPSMTPMINFFNTWYVPNNMGLVLVGNFNAEAVKPLIEKTFGQMQSKPLPERKPTVPAPLTKNEKIKIKLGYSPSVVWGYEGVKEGHPDQFKLGFVLSLLNNDYGTGLLDKLMIDGTIGGAYAQMLSQRDCGKIIIQAEPYYDVNGGYYDDDATTEKLVMTEINKLKRGSVPQWLLQSIKDLYLRKIKTYAESSGIKTNILTDVFLFNEDIEDYFNMEAKVKAITLEDVKEVANKYFSGYFTTISFDEGEPKTEQFVKAQIKPLENPDAQYSQYYADFNKIPVSEPIPTYIDFSDVKQKKLFDGGELFYVENKKNDVFLLTLEYQVGTHADKKLEYAAALMNYAGIMGQKNNYELRRELSRYGASYGVGISDNKFVIQVLGNEKDLDKVMNFISLMCVMPDLDKKQIESVMTSEALRRMYEKKIPALVNNALMQWIYYGDQSPYIDRYSSKELIFISQTTGDYNLLIGKEDLTVAIQKITSYPVKVHYTGQKPIEEVAQILQKVPTQKTMLAAQPDFYRD
ncbi:MAG: insulinase family protein, partial [Prevotellaceae bacterium]|nr:insulinase family protein [Prevotellaceae bacterium]